MKARDRAAVAAIRSALAAIDNAEAVDPAHAPRPGSTVIAGAAVGLHAGEVPRLELSGEQVVALVEAEAVERMAAARHYDELGRPDEAARLRAEAAVLQVHLDEAGSPG